MNNTKTKTTSVKPATNPKVLSVNTAKARVEGVNLNITRLEKSVKAKDLNALVEIYSGLFGSNNYRSHLNYDIKKGAIVLES